MNEASVLQPRRRGMLAALLVSSVLGLASPANAAGPDDEIRGIFDRFVIAQNAHDTGAVRELLLDSPNFLWVTRGSAIWGRDAAMKRFEVLYRGTWNLRPDVDKLEAVLVNDTTAQISVPITFKIGPPGQTLPDVPFLMTQTLVKTAAGWRIANILPIPLPPPAAAPPK